MNLLLALIIGLASQCHAVSVTPDPAGAVSGAPLAPASISVTGNGTVGGTLGVTGLTSLSSMAATGDIKIRDGAENDLSIKFADDTNTGIYSTVNDYINIVSNGQDNARFGSGTSIFYNSAGNTFVSFAGSGDNTIVPAGSARFEYGDGSVTTGQRFNVEGQAADPFTLVISSPNGTRLSYFSQNGGLNVSSIQVQNMGAGSITSTGPIVGMTTGGRQVSIEGYQYANMGGASLLSIYQSGSPLAPFEIRASSIALETAAGQSMVLDASGNVGIGSIVPRAPLEVKGAANYTAIGVGTSAVIGNSLTGAAVSIGANANVALIQGIDYAGPVSWELAINPFGGKVTIGSGGTPLAVISTHTSVPTATTFTNLDAVTFIVLNCTRIGNMANCWGQVNIDPTAAAGANFHMPLPIASNFDVQEDCGGVFSDNGASNSGRIYGSAAADTCVFEFTAVDGSSRGFNFNLGYNIE